jgi:dTDP-L-rhamnose 4-epimerase
MIFEDGEQVRDFVHVSDIVQANLLALATDRADYQTLNIGSGEIINIRQVAASLAAGLGKSIEPVITGKYREGDVRHCVPDITRARELLGYKPRVSLQQGMPELIDWVRHQTAQDSVDMAMAELAARQLAR